MLNEGVSSAPVQKYLTVEPTRKVSDPNCWHVICALATWGSSAKVARRVVETRVFNDQVLLLVRILLVFGDKDLAGGNDVLIVVAADAAMLFVEGFVVGFRVSIKRKQKGVRGGKVMGL